MPGLIRLLKTIFEWLLNNTDDAIAFIFGVIFTLIGFHLYLDSYYDSGLLTIDEIMKSKKEMVTELNNKIDDLISNFEDAYYHSKKRQTRLAMELLRGNNMSSGRVLDIANRNKDMSRSIITHLRVLQKNLETTPNDLDEIDLLTRSSEAYVKVQRDKHDAYRQATDIYSGLLGNPDLDSEMLELELLRNLTYCYFATGSNNRYKYWLGEAQGLQENDLSRWRYETQYFWIDLFALTTALRKGKFNESDDIFQRMKSHASPDFLTAKLLQHKVKFEKQSIEQRIRNYLQQL